MPTPPPPSPEADLAALVACGGASSRMGTPKAWLTWRQEPFLTRITRQLTTVAQPVIVVAAPGQALPPVAEGVRRVEDHHALQGPLAALQRGLEELGGSASRVFFCGCDAPLLAPQFVSRLASLLDRDHDLAIVDWQGRLQGCACLVRAGLRTQIEQLLHSGRRRLLDLVEVSRALIVDAGQLAEVDPQLWSLRGVNTPEQLAALIRDAAEVP